MDVSFSGYDWFSRLPQQAPLQSLKSVFRAACPYSMLGPAARTVSFTEVGTLLTVVSITYGETTTLAATSACAMDSMSETSSSTKTRAWAMSYTQRGRLSLTVI